jgi:hypothetical protein
VTILYLKINDVRPVSEHILKFGKEKLTLTKYQLVEELQMAEE